SDGVRQWGSYYGGSEIDRGASCATDGFGNVYLAGRTQSVLNIASAGHQNTYEGGTNDAFLVKFNSAGLRQWGTYYGGSGNDWSYSCDTDGSGNVYLAGQTQYSTNIASGGHQNANFGFIDAFLVKFKQSKIIGWVWQDLNSNCVQDTAELGVVDGIRFIIEPGNYIVESESGIWSIDSLPTGTYTVIADTSNPNWLLTCPVSQTFT